MSPETGKNHLLLLDFLWHTERHELCHPASLICENQEVAQKMTENLEKDAGMPIDIEEAEKKASEDVVAQREESLAKQLSEMKRRKKKLVDPLQFEMSIQAEDLSSYVPSFGWEMGPPSDKQKNTLEKLGILPDQIDNAGKAAKILDRLEKRRNEGLTTPKQIRFLEGRGFQHVGTWQFETAKNLIDRDVYKRQLVAISESFFFHTSQDFSGEPDRVIFVHPLNDTLDQGAKRTVYKWLRYAYYLHMIFLEHTLVYDRLLLITGKSGVFPDQYHINRMRGLFGNTNHTLKLRTLLHMPAGNTFGKDKIIGDNDTVLFCIVQ